MKKVLLALLAITLSLSVFSGCSEAERGTGLPSSELTTDPAQDTDLPPSELPTDAGQDTDLPPEGLATVEGVISVHVSSLPEGYTYSFSEESARAIVDYFAGLNLISDFSEDPDEYAGMTWVVSIAYEDGTETTLYHFGNMFVRREDGPWYQLAYSEASQFNTLLHELKGEQNNGESESEGNIPDNSYATVVKVWDWFQTDSWIQTDFNPYFSVILPAFGNSDNGYIVIERRADDMIYANGEYLTGGMGYFCENFYLCDLTGDGYPELCFTMAIGSGLIRKHVEIIDYTTRTTLFTLDAPEGYVLFLFPRDGVLCVAEVGNIHSRTGVLTYDGSEVTVIWDREADFRSDP